MIRIGNPLLKTTLIHRYTRYTLPLRQGHRNTEQMSRSFINNYRELIMNRQPDLDIQQHRDLDTQQQRDYTCITSKTFFTHRLFIALCVLWVFGTIGFISISLVIDNREDVSLILAGLSLSLPCLYVICRKVASKKDGYHDNQTT